MTKDICDVTVLWSEVQSTCTQGTKTLSTLKYSKDSYGRFYFFNLKKSVCHLQEI